MLTSRKARLLMSPPTPSLSQFSLEVSIQDERLKSVGLASGSRAPMTPLRPGFSSEGNVMRPLLDHKLNKMSILPCLGIRLVVGYSARGGCRNAIFRPWRVTRPRSREDLELGVTDPPAEPRLPILPVPEIRATGISRVGTSTILLSTEILHAARVRADQYPRSSMRQPRAEPRRVGSIAADVVYY